jgi:hypothetical protein
VPGRPEKVIVFLKSCDPGQVKTRIAREVGDEAALLLYTAMIKDLYHNLQPLREKLVSLCDAPGGGRPLLPEAPGLEQVRMQEGADLGERMYRAFLRVFEEGATRAVLIGSDIPYIYADWVEMCLQSLRDHDAALGPAADGGYYLIGFSLSSLTREPFRDMTWGTGSVLDETIRRLQGRRLHFAPELRDIDQVEDLRAVLGSNKYATRLPEVRRVIRKRRELYGSIRL